MSFYEWLLAQQTRRDRVGHLARDVFTEQYWQPGPCLRHDDGPRKLRRHMERAHDADQQALDAFDQARAEYRAQTRPGPVPDSVPVPASADRVRPADEQ